MTPGAAIRFLAFMIISAGPIFLFISTIFPSAIRMSVLYRSFPVPSIRVPFMITMSKFLFFIKTLFKVGKIDFIVLLFYYYHSISSMKGPGTNE
jgi:hypothetical protein